MITIQKIKGSKTNDQDADFSAYVKGQEIQTVKVYFDGDDFSLFDLQHNKFIKDEHGYSFFGIDKAEELLNGFVLNQDKLSS